jgi:hypothetical protein
LIEVAEKPDNLRRDLLALLKRLDEHLTPGQTAELYLGGGAAILLAYNGKLATVDVDFIGEESGLLLELSQFAAKGSETHRLTKLYLDIVPPGMFPADLGWRNRTIPVSPPELHRLKIRVLEIHDLVISKLKRFAGKDRQDIRGLCGRPELNVQTLRARYREARLLSDYDERERLDQNFNVVEVEFLGLEPTVFE